MSCLFVLIISSFLLGIASIGLAAAYYSAGNDLSLFGKNCFFLVDLFFMLMTPLQLLSGLTKVVEVPLPLCGVNNKTSNNCCLCDLLCFNALFLTQPAFPSASIFNNDI